MKRSMAGLLFAGASALGLLTTHAAGAATFDFTGVTIDWIVPASGVYEILTYGAQGGPGLASGGLGAEAGGGISLTAGTTLSILVGGQGGYGGGGGGSFVFDGFTLLAAAGGGGGGGTIFGTGGLDGEAGTSGGSGAGVGTGPGAGGVFVPGGAGGVGGSGGAAGHNSGGGAGVLGGGGGGGLNANCYPTYCIGGGGGGGGGGSYLDSAFTNVVLYGGARAGDGFVSIDKLTSAVPEPATWVLMGLGFVSLGAFGLRLGKQPQVA